MTLAGSGAGGWCAPPPGPRPSRGESGHGPPPGDPPPCSPYPADGRGWIRQAPWRGSCGACPGLKGSGRCAGTAGRSRASHRCGYGRVQPDVPPARSCAHTGCTRTDVRHCAGVRGRAGAESAGSTCRTGDTKDQGRERKKKSAHTNTFRSLIVHLSAPFQGLISKSHLVI